MTDGDNIVRDVERVEVEPAADDGEGVILPEGVKPEDVGEGDEGEGGEGEAGDGDEPEIDPLTGQPKKDEIVGRQQPAAVVVEEHTIDPNLGLVRAPNETPNEFALRVELTKTRNLLKRQRTGEITDEFRDRPAKAQKKELSEASKAVLGKYKPEELESLREVLPVLAEEMGFVRKDELNGSTYAEKAQEILDQFVEDHPEYKPENDPNGTKWEAFKSEYGMFKQPADPRDFRKIFAKVHQTVFGITAGKPLPKVIAAQKKVNVASHAGASGPTPAQRQMKPGGGKAGNGLRLDALKGFSEEEIAAMAGDGE